MNYKHFVLWALFIVHRALSGFRNGTIYVESRNPSPDWAQWRFVASGALSAITVALMMFSPRAALPDWLGWIPAWMQTGAAAALCVSSILCTALCGVYKRLPGKWADLHLYTLGEQTFLAVGLFIASPTLQTAVTLALAVYPSVFLQKWLVNWSGGQPWHYDGTDDPTGKYYSIPLLGVKIPRFINQKWRAVLAILSIFAFITIRILN